MSYTMSIFDSDSYGKAIGEAWPDYKLIKVSSIDKAKRKLEIVAARLNESDGYEVGDFIIAHIWNHDGNLTIINHKITKDDLC